jgi:hypothetical protein
MDMSTVGLGPKNGCTGEAQQQLETTDPTSCQGDCPTSTNPQLPDININLVMGPSLECHTRTE